MARQVVLAVTVRYPHNSIALTPPNNFKHHFCEQIGYYYIIWLPANPNNLPFDVQKRIETLLSYLDPGNPYDVPERQQHVNIKAIIKLWEGKNRWNKGSQCVEWKNCF